MNKAVNEEGLDITVEYCSSCNYLPRTMWMVGEILTDIPDDVKRLSLVPGRNGSFEWFVDGELVYSKIAADRNPETGKIEGDSYPEMNELKALIFEKMH